MRGFRLAALVLVAIISLLVLAGCGAAAAPRTSAESSVPVAPAAAPPSAPRQTVPAATQVAGAKALDAASASSGAPLPAAAEQLVIRTGTLRLRVADTRKAVDEATKLINDVKGNVVNVNLRVDAQERVLADMRVRVPAQSYDATMNKLEQLGVKTITRTEQGQDVTEEYVDLKARQTNLEAVEKQLLAMMQTERERGAKTADILQIYDQATRKREEIDRIKARTQYLEQSAAMSTINLTFEPTASGEVIGTAGWNPGETFRRASAAFVAFIQGLVDLGIWVGIFSLCLIPFIIILFVLIVWLRRRARRSKPAIRA